MTDSKNMIKNLHLLDGIVKQSDLDKMEHAAMLHRRHGNLTFKIIDVNDKKVLFQVRQGKSAAENYHSAKRLIEIVHETFGRFFPGRKLNAGPIVFRRPDPDQVNHDWIISKMKDTKTRLKDISDDTGIDYSYLSTLTSGAPLSQPVKAFFWYYFLSKK